jgi:predicted DNA-binding protein YlxM (UPF0122 family)
LTEDWIFDKIYIVELIINQGSECAIINCNVSHMEERVKISILLDLYGDLLTEKQKDVMELYYNDDLSLGEISEITSTSRQAVHDIIKRCNKLLIHYEEKLGLMNTKFKMKQVRNHIIGRITDLSVECEYSLEKLEELKKYIIDNI